MDYGTWMKKAKSRIERVPHFYIFCLKDLFMKSEWDELKKGEKLNFGKYFKNAVNEKKLPNVKYIGKADNNSAQYQKTGGE